jgi:carboxyl-terminal processing protease
MRTGTKVLIGILIGILVIGGCVVAGFAIQKALKKNNVAGFKLEDQPAYREALFDIKSYYLRPYSEAKITAAGNAAVAKDKKKGVTSTLKLTNDGMSALVNALGDPHTQYLTAAENKRLSQDLSGTFYGVGFTLKLDKKRPKVVSVIKGSPSDKAGIKTDDVIMAVDGKDTYGESLDSVVLRIRGKQGTKVKVDIQRNGKPMTFVMTRAKIEVPDFESELQDGKYGVLKLYEFNQGVGDKVRQAVKDLQAKGAQGFILDLRNDPGGLVSEAVAVASVFIPNGTIVSYQTKGSKKVDMTAQGGAQTDKPLVVLVNGGSASASEIVTGAIKDRKRGTIVGSKTYGKGSVQKVYDLTAGSGVKLTISLYYLPNGETIDGKGIIPDIIVTDKDPNKADALQNEKAKQVLQNLIDGKPATGWVEEELQRAA